MQQMNSMQDLMQNMLIGLYTAEQQALEALPQMAEHVETPELKNLLQQHEKHTENQCRRLEQIFDKMGMEAPEDTYNPAVAALMEESQDMIDAGGNQKVLEAALILGAQKMEHLEIAGYGTAVEFAKMLGEKDLAKLLAENLNEEEKTDKMLTDIARAAINPKAKEA